MQIVKEYKANSRKRRRDEEYYKKLGYEIISVEELSKRSAVKTVALGVVFLPLALLGKNKKVRVTYEKK